VPAFNETGQKPDLKLRLQCSKRTLVYYVGNGPTHFSSLV